MDQPIIPPSYQEIALNATYQIDALLTTLVTVAREYSRSERGVEELQDVVEALVHRVSQLNGAAMSVLSGAGMVRDAFNVDPGIALHLEIKEDQKNLCH